MKVNDPLYFDLSGVLSYNALLNFVIGFRSAGKTYAFKDWAIRSWLKTGAQFVYLRRYEVEVDAVKHTLFDDIAEKYHLHFKCVGNTFFVNRDGCVDDETGKPIWESVGFILALSGFAKYKSASFNDVDKICYDEFLIENKNSHYLKNEMQALASLYHTIARRRRVRLVAMANSSDIINPFFDNYHIRFSEFLKSNTIFRNDKTVLFVYYKNPEAQASLARSEQATAFGESFADYAFAGNFLENNESMCCEKFGQYEFNLTNGHYYVSVYREQSRLWISKQMRGGATYTTNMQDFEHDLNDNVISYLRDRVQRSAVFFEDVTAKLRFVDIMKL